MSRVVEIQGAIYDMGDGFRQMDGFEGRWWCIPCGAEWISTYRDGFRTRYPYCLRCKSIAESEYKLGSETWELPPGAKPQRLTLAELYRRLKSTHHYYTLSPDGTYQTRRTADGSLVKDDEG